MGTHDEDQIQNLTTAISSAIIRFLHQEEKQALQKNSSKFQSSQIKGKKKNPDDQQHFYLKTQSFYDELVNVLDKLSKCCQISEKIMKRMNTITKIKKPKLNIFNAQLMEFIQELSNLIETKSVNLKIDKYVVALVEQTNKSLTQCDRILTTLEKQSSAFCCSRYQETKYTFYRSIIRIIGYGHVWIFVPRFSPMIQEKIQKVEVYTPIRYDIQGLQKTIQKQVYKYWPEERQKQVEVFRQIKCERPHVDSQVIESKQSAVSSLSESEESQIKVLNQAPVNNYIKIQEVTKLKQDLEIEKQLRQAHQKLFGFGRSQQINEAFQVYKKIADKKSDKSNLAFNSLGQIYEEGKFTEIDRQKSQEYYRRSAALNDPQGMYKLGKYIEKGMIKINDPHQNPQQVRNDQFRAAVEYYQKAAEMNHLDAITDLGFIYEKGIQNQGQFLKVSTVSKSQNDSSISKNTDTNSKFFIEPNLNYALKYYTIGKKAEYPRAINNLGALLVRQHENIPERVKGTNLQKGIKYLKKAVQLGYLKAYFNLAKCYQYGIGVSQSYEHAKKYYLRGSQKGDITCKVQYIKCFFTDGFPKNAQTDDSQLAKLIQLVKEVLIVDPNNKECLFYMGLFHERGDGVIQNPQIAYNYVYKSANLQFLPAITKLGDYKYSGFYTKKDLQAAVQLYEKAAKAGQPQAMLNLSLILEKGLIKPHQGSITEYIKYLQNQAMKKNSSNAFLIAGLREQNYRINSKSSRQLNQKIMKSLELGNRDAVNLVQKTRRNDVRQKKIIKNDAKLMTQRTLNTQINTDRTLPFSPNPLKKIKSFHDLRITKN